MNKLLLAAFVLAAAACGPKSKGPSEPPPGGGDAKRKAWSDMDHEEREEFMEKVVMPTMKEKFQAFDATEFANFTCGTCHISAEDHAMPNPNLPRLDFSKAPEDHTPEQMKIGQFMVDVVTPEMAKLLGVPVFDPATQQGFGCLGCHMTVEAEGGK